jgi:hypothetical protein
VLYVVQVLLSIVFLANLEILQYLVLLALEKCLISFSRTTKFLKVNKKKLDGIDGR